MATVSFANLHQTFDIDAQLVTFLSVVHSVSAPAYVWQPATGTVGVRGDQPFPVALTPQSGTVNSFTIDFGFNSINDLSITGLSFSLPTLITTLNALQNAEAENNYIWRSVLSGNDAIDLGIAATTGGFYLNFNGDGRNIESGQAILGGDDTITGDAGNIAGFSSVQGDFSSVAAGGAAFGGNDSINVTSNLAYGDVKTVFGFLSGGNDKLSLLPGGSGATAYGDAWLVSTAGSVVGGDDFIMLAGNSGATAYGDVGILQGNVVGGDDTITGSGGADTLGGDAFDVVSGSTFLGGNDLIHGGGGGDFISGDWEILEAGRQTGGGNDILFGDAGNDTIHGNGGNDLIHGGGDQDTMFGDDGNDTLFIDATTDVVAGETYDGGAGRDTLQIADSLATFAVDLRGVTLLGLEVLGFGDPFTGHTATIQVNAAQFGGLGFALNGAIAGRGFADITQTLEVTMGLASALNLSGLAFTGFSSTDHVVILGDASNETITGSRASDVITGGGGIDILAGGLGNDILNGGIGNDTLFGGAGKDTLTGGLNNDFFVFNTALNAATNRDTITDFNHVADTFKLENAIFTKLGAGVHALNPLFFRAGVKALDGNDYVVYDKATGILSYDSDGSGSHAAIQFAVLSNKPVLAANDFLVI